MRRYVFALLAIVFVGVPIIVIGQAQAIRSQTPAASAQLVARPAAPPSASGRYVMMSPPQAAQGNIGLDNFMWVLDTQTGTIAVHRILQVKNSKGELSYWAHEALVDEDSIAAYQAAQDNKSESQR